MQRNIETLPRLANGDIRFARGWYMIGGSEDFPAAEVKSLRYFSQDLVAFRTEQGHLQVLDAYCPHLGAHLGVGGKVVEETIQCPFHAWRFDGEGQCVDIPYAKRIPPRACTKSWHVTEHSGVAFLWYDPQGNEPHYQVPEMPEFGQSGWSGWNLQRLDIKTHPREIIENVSDSAHFVTVHKMNEVLGFENHFEDHMATQKMSGKMPGGKMSSTATYYGPAFQYTWMTTAVESRLINANTPIDENNVHLWFGVMIQESNLSEEQVSHIQHALDSLGFPEFELNAENMSMIHEALIHATQQGYYDDVAIWENKLFRTDPTFCDGDGPLHKLRKWYGQFYTDR